MAKYEYEGVAYRQGRQPEAVPWIISFVAPAEELLEWAGIPRRSEHNFSGFQRAIDDSRVDRAKGFFEQPENQSPTALIVGLHPGPSRSTPEVTLEFSGEDSPIRRCRLTVDFDSAELLNPAVVLARVRRQIEYRLDAQAATALQEGGDVSVEAEPLVDNLQEDDSDTEDDEPDVGDGEEPLDPDAVAEEDDIELGRSILEDLLRRLDDPEWTGIADNAEALRDMAKPATIIDGQHRVLGAEKCERQIPFTICALYDCEWSEQVFQFTVVNYTAKGIPDQFITASAALSLTADELTGLQTRLVQAGVKVIEYELMKVVQFDARSPFYQLVNLSEKSDPAKIGYRTMVRIAKNWYAAKDLCFAKILPNIYPDLRGKRQKAARADEWKREAWGEFFLDFWRVVHDRYKTESSHVPGSTLWTVGQSHLIVAVVLLELQDLFFRNLNAQDEEFFEVGNAKDPILEMRGKLEKRAKRFVEWLPPEFFSAQWGLSSLSIGPGRIALRDALNKLVDTNGKYQFGKSALITGKTDQ